MTVVEGLILGCMCGATIVIFVALIRIGRDVDQLLQRLRDIDDERSD